MAEKTARPRSFQAMASMNKVMVPLEGKRSVAVGSVASHWRQ